MPFSFFFPLVHSCPSLPTQTFQPQTSPTLETGVSHACSAQSTLYQVFLHSDGTCHILKYLFMWTLVNVWLLPDHVVLEGPCLLGFTLFPVHKV